MGAQNSVSSAALSKQQSLAATGFHGTLFLSKNNFLNFLIADRFLSCQLGRQC